MVFGRGIFRRSKINQGIATAHTAYSLFFQVSLFFCVFCLLFEENYLVDSCTVILENSHYKTLGT